MNQNTEAPSCLYFCIGRMLSIAPLQDNELHRHGAIQITMAMEQPFAIRIEDGDWQETKAVIIDSNVSHQLKGMSGFQISLSIVPERNQGKHLQQYVLKGSKLQYLDKLDLSQYRNKFQHCLDQHYSCPRAFQLCDEFIDHLTGVRGYSGPLDERIQRAINWIQQNLSKPISAHKLAGSFYLSEDRFLHLFKEQLGLPLRQYILYQRVMTATMEHLRGNNLTEAAYRAGFSDSAHFTRTFIKMNGIKPSQFARQREKLQFCFCSSFCDACNQLRKTITR